MVKENIAINKPPEIVELEKAYGVVLEKVERTLEKENSFSLDEEGQVNGLSIINAKINDITPIGKLKNLEYLSLKGNLIEDITPLFPQEYLEYLDLSLNKIKNINSIIQCPKITNLYIYLNPIYDISPIKQLYQLNTLFYSSTGITDFSILENLEHLKFVYLGFSGITAVPKFIIEKFELSTQYKTSDIMPVIDLVGNPLQFPPISVIELGRDTVNNYYKMSEQFGNAPLSEGRIIFVGDGSSGKSSIIERILYNSFAQGRPQTNGIKIEHLHLQHPEDNRDLTFHIWDFGGQEIQHAVHKFFFTEGCLYVLVLDNRKEEEPDYWLQQIETLGGKAPVLVVFNKHDENAAETVDRKYLKEKYPNIAGFYNTSCKTGFGMEDLKKEMERELVKLRTVDEKFPKNWLSIKKAIEQHTAGSQHYLTYEAYLEICKQNSTDNEPAQKLLLKYFNTIGTVTWFGEDIYLKFMHVLHPAWITQGVYKIITAKKTASLYGQINISDFNELLQPISSDDYNYDEKHYGYILSLMKKFDLCDAPDDKHILIPSAFGKVPRVEYRDFKGESVCIYVLQFKDYMPLALIHRFIAKKISQALDNNYWYTGIVIKDSKSDSLAMVHADKEAKRIYVRIKGKTPLGLWDSIRRELKGITSSYAKIPYEELVLLDEKTESYVNYEDLINHIKAQKSVYFHSKLQKDFNVGYLMGWFETKEDTIEKVTTGEIRLQEREVEKTEKMPSFVFNILNNNNPTVNTQVNTQVNIDIDIKVVNNLGSELKGEARYLLDELGDSNEELYLTLEKVIQFAEDAKAAKNSGDIKEKGWGRKLKKMFEILSKVGSQLKNVKDGGETLHSIMEKIQLLSHHFNLDAITALYAATGLGNII
jgi:internalin A